MPLRAHVTLITLVVASWSLSSSLCAQGGNRDYTLRLQNAQWGVGFEVEVDVVLTTQQPGVEAFWLGVCLSDPRIQGSAIAPHAALQVMNGGLGPDVLMLDTDPLGGSGVTCGTIFALDGSEILGIVTSLPVLSMTYDVSQLPVTDIVQLSFCDTLDVPPFETVVVVGGVEHSPVGFGMAIGYGGLLSPLFIRGDVNQSGSVNVADAVALLSYLFSGGTVDCREALDLDGSASLDVADAIRLLTYLFSGASTIAQPFPACGVGIAQHDCVVFTACP